MYTKKKVRNAIVSMSDEDFQNLVDDMESDAREVATGSSGRTEQALALAKHYDTPGRSLGTLVSLIREIAPDVEI